MTNSHQRVLIVGASTRAAAESAKQAGWQPVCADLFADEDLRDCAEVLPIENYPAGLIEAVASTPECPWMYTGALENHPDIIERISETRPLWGNGIRELQRVRDPFRLFEILSTAGLQPLAVRTSDDPPPADESWLLKPVRTAGGRRIRIWDADAKQDGLLPEDCFFQQRATGQPISAVYIASPTGVVLVGVTRQLIGEAWTSAKPFAYCGSVGPIELASEMTNIVRETGTQLAQAAGLRGLFGCDFLYDEATKTTALVEVNPRYTASVELFERATGVSLLAAHRAACETPGEEALTVAGTFPRSQVVGKAIWYTARDIIFPGVERLVETTGIDPSDMADRPARGTLIAAGQPICTVFARAKTADACIEGLKRRLTSLSRVSTESA